MGVVSRKHLVVGRIGIGPGKDTTSYIFVLVRRFLFLNDPISGARKYGKYVEIVALKYIAYCSDAVSICVREGNREKIPFLCPSCCPGIYRTIHHE